MNSLSEIAEKYDKMSMELHYLHYPKKPKKPSEWTYKNKEEFKENMAFYEEEEKKFENNVKEYRRQMSIINELFRVECIKYLGLENHPKAEKFWALCWSFGHSGGYFEVANWAEELIELLN